MVMASMLAALISTAVVAWAAPEPVAVEQAPDLEQPAQVGPKVLTGSIDSGLYAGRQPDQDAVVASPRLQVGVRARPEVELGVSLGFVSLTAAHREDGRIRDQSPGNFIFGTRWVRDDADARHHGHLGFAFALPTTLEPTRQALDAHRYARASRGGLDPWAWSPATMGVIVPLGWSAHLGQFDVGVDAAFGGLFSAAGDLADPGFVGQVRGAAAYRVWRLRLGAALAAVYNGRETMGALQTSVQPFVEVPLCRADALQHCGLHLTGAVSVNLDAPYGFGPEGMRIWGSQFGLRWAIRDAAG